MQREKRVTKEELDELFAEAFGRIEGSTGVVLHEDWQEREGKDYTIDPETGELWLKCWVRYPDGMTA